jgi:hypothetical protein
VGPWSQRLTGVDGDGFLFIQIKKEEEKNVVGGTN